MKSTKEIPSDGALRLDFEYQPAQKRSLRYVARGGHPYLQLAAPQTLEVGGQRSGKTLSRLMFGVMEYCLRYEKCDMLVLRRTISELDNIIQDLHTFVPNELFKFVQSPNKVATFKNGSRIIFGGCANDVERDIEKYLGQAYPYILVDECAQFSAEVWQRLYARNLVNASCKPDEHDNLPQPAIVGCTNPIGNHWGYYHTVFVKKQPWQGEEGSRKAKDGSWWVDRAGELVCVYNPQDYFYNHTTVLDNPKYIKRDPTIVARLKAMTKDLRDRFLYGLMDGIAGQYFDCWSPEHHIVDLRTDPEAIIWQDWQPVWGGQDWGVGHCNAFYLFTKALVRKSIGNDYKMKTVCFVEIAPDTSGYTSVQFADLIKFHARYPRLPETHPQHLRISGKPVKPSAIYFSHEKFNRVMEAHSPADDYSRLLRDRGLCSVSPATRDRIGSAGYMYNELKMGNVVILTTCGGIIDAIPSLVRDDKHLDDVKKSDAKADDRYDAFRYGLYGGRGPRGEPQIEKDIRRAAQIVDPFARHFFLRKKQYEEQHQMDTFTQKELPYWQTKG